MPKNHTNSVIKAITAIEKYTGKKINLNVYLDKKIPVGAGLGGESSDAASTIMAVDKLFALRLSLSDKLEIAKGVGSDVPFFIYGKTAICSGRGEVVQKVKIPQKIFYVIAIAPFSLSTRDVYQSLQDYSTQNPKHYISHLIRNLDNIPTVVGNRLEKAAIKLAPQILEIKKIFERVGFLAVSMTGSGCGIFGICLNKKEAIEKSRYIKQLNIGEVLVASGRC